MKEQYTILYSLAFSVSLLLCLSSYNSAKVIHFGVDGFLQRCMQDGKHSIIDFLKSSGSSTFTLRTAIQTMSGPGWSNILCGMDSETTGITGNEWNAPWLNFIAPNPITPITGNDYPFPCIFQHLKQKNPNLKVGALYDWDWFMNLNNLSIKHSIDYDYLCLGSNVSAYADCDNNIKKKAIDIISNREFDYLFIYLGQVDEQGHTTGFCSEEYVKRMGVVNDIIEEILHALKDKGIYDETTIIWNTDHGATYLTTHHGDQIDDNLLVPWFITGPGIKKGYSIQKPIKNLDTPATICKILGVESNIIWKSRAVDEVFEAKDKTEELEFLK